MSICICKLLDEYVKKQNTTNKKHKNIGKIEEGKRRWKNKH